MNKNCINNPELNYTCPCSELPLDKHHSLKGGNCTKIQSDCFGNREQLGSSPTCNKKIDNYYSQSEKSFDNRYSAHGGSKQISPYIKTTIGNLFKSAGKMKNIVIHSFNDKFYTEGFTGTDSKKTITDLKKILIKKKVNHFEIFLILNILSMMYFFGISSMWANPKYFAPCIINISFFFAEGVLFLRNKTNIFQKC